MFEPGCIPLVDGEKIQAWPVTSSSYSVTVVEARKKWFAKRHRSDGLEAYHRSHYPEKGPFSVCVHRKDVQTVSLTTIEVNSHDVVMRYMDGFPCEGVWKEPIRMSRK